MREILLRIANAHIQCGWITNPAERLRSFVRIPMPFVRICNPHAPNISICNARKTRLRRNAKKPRLRMTTLLVAMLMTLGAGAQSMKGRVYVGEDIMNQDGQQSNVDATVRLEFVSDTEARLTPSIKAKPDANFMMKIGLKMAQKKMAKAVAKKPLLKYTVSNGVITVVGGGKKGKGDVVYTIKDGGNSLRCNDGEKTYTLKRKK